jgi:hypothetical protein
MSRRFGRQQKRKMRAALEVVSNDVQMLSQMNDNKRRVLSHLETRIGEFLHMLPENSVFKPLRDVDYVSVDYPYLNVHRRRDLDEVNCEDSPGGDLTERVECIPLVNIFAILERNQEHFAEDVWLRAKSSEMNKGYVLSVSRKALMRPTRNMKAILADFVYNQLERTFWPGMQI